MPDIAEAHADMTHAQHRLGVPANGIYGPQASQDEQTAAGRIAELAAAGDVGGARQFIHELEHRLGPWQADPWHVLRALAGQLHQPGTRGPAT